ncbi:MAG TPA: penicillin-binding transpeptidase domain-containing protein [Nocardioides sp.]|uniref:penicillin-binding transpeptidase domain-containing protein n=1 Tax=Nocardioides sp. TaxID=35761 RepID=UPI002E2F5F80|nr:penicillin-binding transpeptidase domain-containing protein [Nocardioides sp.]HEX3930268.1 penicillin-binding transpeptidase domain-containing protein [Nocardioides sp.]
MGSRRRLHVVPVLALALVPALAACGGSHGPSPDPTADALATGLSSGDLSAVRLTGGTVAEIQQEYAADVAGLGEVKPKVTVSSVSRSDDQHATATLSWSWPVGSGWTYSTKAALRTKSGSGAWEVEWAPSVVASSLRTGETLHAATESARRADILGPHGIGLVTDRPVVKLGVDRLKVSASKAAASARSLAQLVGIDVAPYVAQVKAAGPKAFVQAIVYRQDEVPSTVTAHYTGIKGVDAIATQLPLGITKEFAAPILGTVGPVTAEIIKDNPGVYRAGDLAGLSGLEARYDAQLRGAPGVVVTAVDGSGTSRTLFKQGAHRGPPLRLTLEPRLQMLAEHILSTVGPPSAIVAIRPSTGAVLVAANGPGNNGYDDATYGRYAPGSTFKTVATLALLKQGVTPSSPIDCPTSVDVDGKIFTNDSEYPPGANGRITLATALANSCNTAYINERTKLGSSDLVSAAATLGMGVDHDLGFPAYFGNVVPPTSETTKAADMIGQGQILASPMTMATVMASVLAGHTVVPQLVTSVQPPPVRTPSITGSQEAALKQMLRGVVEHGTGEGLLDVPGPPVIAKTGTAEFDSGGQRLTHAWMIAGQGDLAVCAFVNVGHTGAGVAGPLLEQFLRGALAR